MANGDDKTEFQRELKTIADVDGKSEAAYLREGLLGAVTVFTNYYTEAQSLKVSQGRLRDEVQSLESKLKDVIGENMKIQAENVEWARRNSELTAVIVDLQSKKKNEDGGEDDTKITPLSKLRGFKKKSPFEQTPPPQESPFDGLHGFDGDDERDVDKNKTKFAKKLMLMDQEAVDADELDYANMPNTEFVPSFKY
jgi:regulator of replication initiation timing